MIEVGKKYGCLTVLDNGEEYSQTDDYRMYVEEAEELRKGMQSYIDKQDEMKRENPALCKPLTNDGVTPENLRLRTEFYVLRERFLRLKRKYDLIKLGTDEHYKCQCKCGKIHYFNATTIERKPKYCFYPIAISTRDTYSTKAENAKHRKREKYADVECVTLVDKSECVPSEEYCKYYNEKREKEIEKAEEKERQIEEAGRIEEEKRQKEREARKATATRVYAKGNEIDYTGRNFESLHIEECINDHEEGRFNESYIREKDTLTIYREYRCKCYLCGKEQIVRGDKFNIDLYYFYEEKRNEYRGDVFCKCHKPSSFEWETNKLLFENNVPYQVEYSFPDLIGSQGVRELRFDFAVFNKDGTIKCLIECNGEQHYEPVESYGGEAKYKEQIANDSRKKSYADEHGIPLLIISYRQKKYEAAEKILKENGII